MGDKVKELLLKAVMVLEIILIVVLFPGMIVVSFAAPTQEIFNNIFYTILSAFIFLGLLFMVLWLVFGGVKTKAIQAEKRAVSFENFEMLKMFLDVSLDSKGYQKPFVFSQKGNGYEVYMYVKKAGIKTLNCFSLIKVEELSDSSVEAINDCISILLNEYYSGNTITDAINMISLFCVDRINPIFKRLVNNNVRQGLKNGRLVAGVSFGGKKIYIAKQKDGFAFAKYKKMRKELFEIIRTENTDSPNKGRLA